MSSKGQVVIPESIRKQLDLKEGAQFLVVGEGDVVVLKVVNSFARYESVLIRTDQAGKSNVTGKKKQDFF